MTTVIAGKVPTNWEARRDLLRAYPRLVRWAPTVGSLCVVAGMLAWKVGDVATADGALWLVRGVALVMCLGAAFLLDDASATLAATAPLPMRVRMGWRCLLLTAVVALGVLSAAVLCAQRVSLTGVVGGLVVEVSALMAVTVATALVLQGRWGIDEPGQFAGVGVIVTYGAAFALGSRWPMFVGPGPAWSDAHTRWLVVALMATAVIALQLRDPARRSWRSMLSRTPG